MGRRGPAPTPTPILRLTGSRRAKAREQHEPKPPEDRPVCPRHLTKDQRAVWRKLSTHLRKVGLLTSVDADTMERYAVAYVRWRQCEKWIEGHGIKYPIKNKKGEVTSIAQFPEVSEARSLAKQLLEMAREFGLTPAARARIGIDTVASKAREVKDVSEIGFTAG